MSSDKPRFENAPGNTVRGRKDGTWVCFWQARTDIVKEGYRPALVPVWRGHEPTAAERAYVSDTCTRAQIEMLAWRHRNRVPTPGAYDGSLASLVVAYRTDKDSGYQKLRYDTRRYYDSLVRRIANDRGDVLVQDIKSRDLKRWHEEWTGSGVAMAHSLMALMRVVATFGASILESEECAALRQRLSLLTFAMSAPREEQLTAEHAAAICAKAHAAGMPELALAQAIQFDCMLRQRDVIGNWVPIDGEPGISDVIDGRRKWLRGIRWSEIDGNLVLKHVTSKRQKLVEHDLKLAPMVLAELTAIYGSVDRAALPASGPVIVSSQTGRPFAGSHFRTTWRALATAAGVPKQIRNQDSRAGAITEATDSGAALEDVRHAAAHSNISMTQRYSRGAAEKTATVMQMRAAFRKGKNES